MSLLPRRSAHIPGGSRSLFAVLSFLLLLTLPQHLAEGESKVPAGHTVPDTTPPARHRAAGAGKGLCQHLL